MSGTMWRILCLAALVAVAAGAPTFTLGPQYFLKDGEPFRVVSGSYHYFRVHPNSWADRLAKAKAGGLNAIQFYIPWNLHEPEPEQYNFEGYANVTHFLQLAHEAGLLVVLRPGPYSCGEWEFGGFPYWIGGTANMHLRSADPQYLSYVQRWWDVLLPKLVPYLYSNGGPIVLCQVENEFGSFGNDHQYMQALVLQMRAILGDDIILHTTDGPGDSMLQGSALPNGQVYQTIDFGPGTDPAGVFPLQRKYQPVGPPMNSEYYTGWLTHWGDSSMASTDAKTVATWLNKILAYDNYTSVNLYMYVGGTNWGFMNGANTGSDPNDYQPTVTSYDYDSPISENGDLTDKYYAVQQVIANYLPINTSLSDAFPARSRRTAYGPVTMTAQANLFDSLDDMNGPIFSPTTLTFEELGQAFGFVLYRTFVQPPNGQLVIQEVHDRAWVYLDGVYQGNLSRNLSAPTSISLAPALPGGSVVDLLVENQGRVNYGYNMGLEVGVTRGVRWGGQFFGNYSIFSLPLTAVTTDSLSSWGPIGNFTGAAFYSGVLTVTDTPTDTYVILPGWRKGVVYINGHNVGRYWEIGPQYWLYVNAALLVQGNNDIVVFELEGVSDPTIIFQDTPAGLRRRKKSGGKIPSRSRTPSA